MDGIIFSKIRETRESRLFLTSDREEMRRMETLEEVAAWQKKMQEMIMDNSEHHIPAIFHMEGMCGAFIQDSTSFPSGIGRGSGSYRVLKDLWIDGKDRSFYAKAAALPA